MNVASTDWKIALERELKSARMNVWILVVCVLVIFLLVMAGLLRAQDLAQAAHNRVRSLDAEVDGNKRERQEAMRELKADNARLLKEIRELKKAHEK